MRLFTSIALTVALTLTAVSNATSSGDIHSAHYALNAPVVALVSEVQQFALFAKAVGVDVDRMLETPPGITSELKMLLAIRVHLALLEEDGPRALSAAGRIRELQTSAEEKAFAGLITQAKVATWRSATPDDDENKRGIRFQAELSQRLAMLPSNEAMLTVLLAQRTRAEGTTREGLLSSARELGTRLDGQHNCSLEDADQIIRLRQRFADILPVKTQLIAALDSAIAARQSPRR